MSEQVVVSEPCVRCGGVAWLRSDGAWQCFVCGRPRDPVEPRQRRHMEHPTAWDLLLGQEPKKRKGTA